MPECKAPAQEPLPTPTRKSEEPSKEVILTAQSKWIGTSGIPGQGKGKKDPPKVWRKEESVRNDRAPKLWPRESNTDFRQRKKEIPKQYFEKLGENLESEDSLDPLLKTYQPRSRILMKDFRLVRNRKIHSELAVELCHRFHKEGDGKLGNQ